MLVTDVLFFVIAAPALFFQWLILRVRQAWKRHPLMDFAKFDNSLSGGAEGLAIIRDIRQRRLATDVKVGYPRTPEPPRHLQPR